MPPPRVGAARHRRPYPTPSLLTQHLKGWWLHTPLLNTRLGSHPTASLHKWVTAAFLLASNVPSRPGARYGSSQDPFVSFPPSGRGWINPSGKQQHPRAHSPCHQGPAWSQDGGAEPVSSHASFQNKSLLLFTAVMNGHAGPGWPPEQYNGCEQVFFLCHINHSHCLRYIDQSNGL